MASAGWNSSNEIRAGDGHYNVNNSPSTYCSTSNEFEIEYRTIAVQTEYNSTALLPRGTNLFALSDSITKKVQRPDSGNEMADNFAGGVERKRSRTDTSVGEKRKKLEKGPKPEVVSRATGTEDDVEQLELQNLVPVTIWWDDKVHVFRVPPETKFSGIRMELAQRIPIRPDSVLIMNDIDEVPDHVTVSEISSLHLESFECPNVNAENEIKVRDLRPGYILLQVQSTTAAREALGVLAIRKTTALKYLIQDYKEKFGLHTRRFKLVFNGEDVDLNKCSLDFHLGDNDVLDVVEI